MNKKESIELAKWAIGIAQKNGVDEAGVNISRSRGISVSFHKRQPETLTEATQNSLSIKIFANNRYSSHNTSNLEKAALEKFIGEAVSMTKYLGEDKFRKLPDPKYYNGQQSIDLNINDAKYDNVTSKQRVEWARAMEDLALSKSDKIISCTSEYGDNKSFLTKVLSNGFEGTREETDYYAYVDTAFKDGEDGRPSDYGYTVARHFDKLDTPEQVAQQAIDRAKRKLGQTKIASGRYDMIVENRAVTRLLGSLYGAMTGRAIQQKNSFLVDKLDQKIASDKLTFIDDPFVERGLASGLFDSEGMAAKKRTIIDKGVLKSYYIDTYYANKMGVEPTRGSKSNVIIEPGTKSIDDLIAQCEKGIFVTSFVGGNSNASTGDFSTGVIGMLVEDGKIIKPVNEMNITGNHTELWHNLVDLGNDVYTISSWLRPSLYFENVEFSGL